MAARYAAESVHAMSDSSNIQRPSSLQQPLMGLLHRFEQDLAESVVQDMALWEPEARWAYIAMRKRTLQLETRQIRQARNSKRQEWTELLDDPGTGFCQKEKIGQILQCLEHLDLRDELLDAARGGLEHLSSMLSIDYVNPSLKNGTLFLAKSPEPTKPHLRNVRKGNSCGSHGKQSGAHTTQSPPGRLDFIAPQTSTRIAHFPRAEKRALPALLYL
ncbi:hypothetical protein BX600DRAFT_554585 [Xylariales sp. PMI_506]|nr:hypothetical protein BX600DRAFT_554585 [Xylariales sp. PMI_506]